jgi:hypothetical protein
MTTLANSAISNSACESLTLVAGCSTKAVIRKGMTAANFEIRMPRFGGLAELGSKCVGNPVSLRAKLKVDRSSRKEPYSATFSISHDVSLYPFRMRNIYDPRSSVESFVRNFNKHMDDCAGLYPSIADLPKLSLHLNDDGESDTLTLTLPPKFAIYTTFLELFPELGFSIKDMVEEDNHVIGGRGSSRTTKFVYGFYNGSVQYVSYRSRIPMQRTSSPYNLWLSPDLEASELPGTVQFQVEIGNWIAETLVSSQPLSFSREDLVLGLDSVFDGARMNLNLSTNIIEVKTAGTTDRSTITISNRSLRTLKELADPATADYITRITVDFSPGIKKALGLLDDDKLTFTTDQERGYTYLIQGEAFQDPFQSKYPVTMIAKSQGTNINYFEGLGYVSLFGFMTEESVKRHMIPIASDGFIFNSDQSNLGIEFYDRAMNLISFEEDYDLHLMIKFRRCF